MTRQDAVKLPHIREMRREMHRLYEAAHHPYSRAYHGYTASDATRASYRADGDALMAEHAAISQRYEDAIRAAMTGQT